MAQREGEKRADGEQRGNTLLMALSPSSHAFRPGRLLPPTTLSSKFSVRPPLPASPQFPPSSPAPTAPVLLLVACLLPPATGITQHDADGSGRWRACVLGEARRVTSVGPSSPSPLSPSSPSSPPRRLQRPRRIAQRTRCPSLGCILPHRHLFFFAQPGSRFPVTDSPTPERHVSPVPLRRREYPNV